MIIDTPRALQTRTASLEARPRRPTPGTGGGRRDVLAVCIELPACRRPVRRVRAPRGVGCRASRGLRLPRPGVNPDYLAEADAVFVGTAMAVDSAATGTRVVLDRPGDLDVHGRVRRQGRRRRRGQDGDNSSVQHASCGLDLSAGQAFLVFASADADPTGAGAPAGRPLRRHPARGSGRAAGRATRRAHAGRALHGLRRATGTAEATEGGGAMPWLVAPTAAAVAVVGRRGHHRPQPQAGRAPRPSRLARTLSGPAGTGRPARPCRRGRRRRARTAAPRRRSGRSPCRRRARSARS